ncbi:unnamed protein product [Paramecium octaurelia]|uniref:EF-hand domain-containing protein n=1 Tax=Paramecium octaurelia TaxID=43137 RepID=A0A8S1VQV3_PAROT|nr:unnamed protein product [Paramecium octaurelia]
MHNYNVDHKYKFQTRIGNWFEEWELDETKKKDYLKNRQNGQLASIVKDTKTNFSLRLASLSFPQDDYIHFGFHLMLQNLKTLGFLSIDIQERLKIGEEAYNITTAQSTQPTVRSVFVIIPYTKEPNYYGDDVLHYGQQFRIVANPRISNNKTFYLHSLPQTPTRCAKISRKQEVCAIESDVFNAVWKLEHADPKIRFEMEGQPVRSDDTVLIKHSFTQHWLASDDIVYQNDFGREREVFVHSYQCLNKTQNLIAEKEGRTTIDIPLRNQEPQNLWKFQVARNQNEQFDESVMDDNRNVKNLMIRVKQQITGKGAYGLRGLAKIFLEMDQNNNGVVEYNDFKWGLRNFGLTLSEDETKMIFQTFDKNGNGKIEFNEFLDAFRLQMSDKRLYYVQRAYASIEQKAGKVTLETMGRLINVKEHPDVLKGYKTERQVFQDFVSHWNKTNPDRVIPFQEFGEFYQDVSSSVQQDETFEAILKKSWNL